MPAASSTDDRNSVRPDGVGNPPSACGAYSDLSVTDIALRCGFGDLAAFSHAFKDVFHEPPSTFRRRHGG